MHFTDVLACPVPLAVATSMWGFFVASMLCRNSIFSCVCHIALLKHMWLICSGRVRELGILISGMAPNRQLPLTHPTRIHARDRKLLFREEQLADEQGLQTLKCKCRICIGSVRSRRRRHVVRKHLLEIGRHPYHRGHTPVRAMDYASTRDNELCYSFLVTSMAYRTLHCCEGPVWMRIAVDCVASLDQC